MKRSRPALELEAFWADVLSADPERIRHALGGLAADEVASIAAHLRRMTDEPGWHPGQRERAGVALTVLFRHDAGDS